MIKANDLNIQTLGERFNALPEKLQAAIQSEENLRAIASSCKKNLLVDEEKIEAVEQIVALVILGIIPLDALAREIDEALILNNLKLAQSISGELNDKIFSTIRVELEKNYKPLDEDDKELMAIIEENIQAGIAVPPPMPSAVPSPLPLKAESRPFATTPSFAKAIEGGQGKEPAPKILQEEASFGKPLRQASGFSLNIPIPKALDAKKDTAPMKPAMLELGSQPTPKSAAGPFGAAQSGPPVVNRAEPRVVHYTELKTPLEQVGGKLIEKNMPAAPTQTNREVKEITGSTGSPQAGQPLSSLYGNSKFDRPAASPPPPMPPSAAARIEPKMNDVVFGRPLTPPAIPPRPAPVTPPLPKPPIPPPHL